MDVIIETTEIKTIETVTRPPLGIQPNRPDSLVRRRPEKVGSGDGKSIKNTVKGGKSTKEPMGNVGVELGGATPTPADKAPKTRQQTHEATSSSNQTFQQPSDAAISQVPSVTEPGKQYPTSPGRNDSDPTKPSLEDKPLHQKSSTDQQTTSLDTDGQLPPRGDKKPVMGSPISRESSESSFKTVGEDAQEESDPAPPEGGMPSGDVSENESEDMHTPGTMTPRSQTSERLQPSPLPDVEEDDPTDTSTPTIQVHTTKTSGTSSHHTETPAAVKGSDQSVGQSLGPRAKEIPPLAPTVPPGADLVTRVETKATQSTKATSRLTNSPEGKEPTHANGVEETGESGETSKTKESKGARERKEGQSTHGDPDGSSLNKTTSTKKTVTTRHVTKEAENGATSPNLPSSPSHPFLQDPLVDIATSHTSSSSTSQTTSQPQPLSFNPGSSHASITEGEVSARYLIILLCI